MVVSRPNNLSFPAQLLVKPVCRAYLLILFETIRSNTTTTTTTAAVDLVHHKLVVKRQVGSHEKLN